MRRVIGWTCAMLAAGVVGAAGAADKGEAKESSVLAHEMETLSGDKVDLAEYEGKVLLIVNVASECGATPQYEPLQALYEKYEDKGLVVLGFPSNQFGGQEPGTSEQISQFCKENYGVTFPMFAKIDVKGPQAAPLYKYLTSEEAVPSDAGDVKWNFEKFLVGRDGKVVARFRTPVKPDSKEVVEAIEKELAKKA